MPKTDGFLCWDTCRQAATPGLSGKGVTYRAQGTDPVLGIGVIFEREGSGAGVRVEYSESRVAYGHTPDRDPLPSDAEPFPGRSIDVGRSGSLRELSLAIFAPIT
jgi:hypothetical protein